ncbi:MAG: c-type cytochrome [Myxococcales bacterium]|nr:c-type cytochrome [Myxococcales bacterium]
MKPVFLVLLAACGGAPEAPPAAPPPAEAPAAFEAYASNPAEIQYSPCVQCHGAHGEGRPELLAPRIGQLDASYVRSQLLAFRAQQRGSHPDHVAAHPMSAVARGLPDAAIELLAPFVQDLHPAPQPPGPRVAGGAGAYAPCAACHGRDALGNPELQAPALLHQDPAYLERQLKAYRDGTRGGRDGAPMDQVMAAQAARLGDARIATLVRHIASLRPPLPPPDDPEVTRPAQEGLDAFADIYAVATHPRCLNCHPDGDAPLQGDDSHPHIYGITRFSPLKGVHCSQCHAPSAAGDGLAPMPPADSLWSMPPRAMTFQNRTPAQLCAQLTDPAVNGGRGLAGLAHHIEADHLLITSWHSGRQPPPISHAELVERFEVWGEAGGPCPQETSAD